MDDIVSLVKIQVQNIPKQIRPRPAPARARPARARARKDKGRTLEDGFICLPYIDEELLCKVKSKVKKSGLNVRIAWKMTKS